MHLVDAVDLEDVGHLGDAEVETEVVEVDLVVEEEEEDEVSFFLSVECCSVLS